MVYSFEDVFFWCVDTICLRRMVGVFIALGFIVAACAIKQVLEKKV